ncbi:META domain-containing protein [Echinicola soli]|uniref:META domain-containing protein n=1 Tax=Echinicola soli TaxID=2591634 RepID=A0A514CEU7_9BACT|nr:copper resistance protein NlpE N-terminal domain-containing protein [Echinicola soli]QDH78343.1 META domain-containing protein [Echinicola soli]
MKQLLYGSFLSLVLLSACTKEKSELPTGTFYTVLPCADCPGISYALDLKADSSYSERMVYQERSEQVSEHSGHLSFRDDHVLVLDKEEKEGMRLFKIHGDSLQMLDIEGKPIESPFADRYFLTKEKPEEFNMKLKEKSFVGFKARGNEPFWSLEMDFSKQMVFKPMEGEPLITPIPKPVRPQDVNAVSYRAETEKGTLHVTVFRRKCQDTMSGEEFGYEVNVRVKQGKDSEFRDYSGCGDYQGDYRLNDIWALETLNGEQLIKDGKTPNLEFNLMENRFYGFGGCNRFSGAISINKQQVSFTKAATTEMACPNLEAEGIFMQHITDQTYDFKIDGLKLTLSNDQAIMVFRKID